MHCTHGHTWRKRNTGKWKRTDGYREGEKPGKQGRENKNVSSNSERRAMRETRWIMMQEKKINTKKIE